MNYLEKLLAGNTVEWKTLGEVCDFQNGFAFKSNLFQESGLPIVRITNIDGSNVDLTDVKYFNPADYDTGNPLNYLIEKGDILIAMSGATTGKIGYYNRNEKAYLNQRVGKFIPNKKLLNSRFLYHFLLIKTNFLYALAGGGAQPNLSSNSLKEKLQIPVPPLAVQAEIVRILDSFTELTAELTAELTLRKKQYAYYREQLLSFEAGNVEWKTLGEVLVPKGYIRGPFGSALKKEFFVEKGIAVYEQQHAIYDSRDFRYFITEDKALTLKRFFVKPNDIIISCSGTIGKISIIKDKDEIGIINQALLLLRFDLLQINIQFIKYYLECFPNLIVSSSGGAITNIEKREIIEKIPIPIPPLAEQERIVGILDKFDTLTSSISEGLPKEIELRTKQYEYYRDMLLSF